MIRQNKITNKELKKQTADLFTSTYFAWYLQEKQIKEHGNQYSGLTHVFYIDEKINSEHFGLAALILDEILKKENITIKSLFRLQANLLLNINASEEQIKNSYHQDINDEMKDKNYMSCVYYVIDSDGDTVIENESVSPVCGNYVIFDSKSIHKAGIPQKHNKRIVINAIFEV